MPIKKKILLGIQKGGAYGAFAWGVIEALLKSKMIEFEAISTTGLGALTAASIAQNIHKEEEQAVESLSKMWHAINTVVEENLLLAKMAGITSTSQIEYAPLSNFQKYSPYLWNPQNYNPLKKLISDFIDFELINSQFYPKLLISATNIKNGKIKIFKNQDLNVTTMLAATCNPFIFQAVEVNGDYYWDGGYIANPAIYPLIYEANSKDFLLITCNKRICSNTPKTSLEIKIRKDQIASNSCLMRELKIMNFITKMIDDKEITDPAVRRMNTHIIEYQDHESHSEQDYFNFNMDFLKHLHSKGLEAGEDWIAKNLHLLDSDHQLPKEELENFYNE